MIIAIISKWFVLQLNADESSFLLKLLSDTGVSLLPFHLIRQNISGDEEGPGRRLESTGIEMFLQPRPRW
jgi:hypothetical protein